MKEGDFSNLGEHYRKYRVGYSKEVLDLILHHIKIHDKKNFVFVDIGAGTGIWTKEVVEKLKDVKCFAIEPNDDMRQNGKIWTKNLNVEWKKGTGEETNLLDNSADWITMASSFHWTDPNKSLPEFHRILKPKGHLTLIWNPLLKEGDKIQEEVEQLIKKIIPEFTRGSRAKDDFAQIMVSTGHFKDIIEIRKVDYVKRSVEDYITTWKAVNHLQAVAGPKRFQQFLDELREMLKNKEYIEVPYLTKSWTAQRVD